MSKVLLFTPKHERDCLKNLADFVFMCRYKLTVFGKDLDWDAENWPGVANFTVIGARSRGYSPAHILNEEILPFAKAYLRYQQGHNPTKLKNELKAIRCIEKALLQTRGCANITLVDVQVLDIAAEVASSYESTAYQAGSQLVKLVSFLNESGIVPRYITWKNPFSKPRELDRTDAESKRMRAEKIPADQYLEFMAEMFANDLESPRDRFTTAIFALLMCAPSRISEVQLLPVNCVHKEIDSKGIERTGLRWWAGKGFGFDIKWVPTAFTDIAIEGIRRLACLSEPGRRLAKYYEGNPDKFYRHDGCPNVDEHEPLTLTQTEAALGLKPNNGNSVRPFFKNYEPYHQLRESGRPLTLSFLHEFCLNQLPKNWPWLSKDLGIKYSEAICCFRAHELRPDLNTSPILLWVPDNNVFTNDLKIVAGRRKKSIWQRHGYQNTDSSPIRMTSHQIRHFLNTAAQRGDLGQLDVAKWSGRVNIGQNAVYNHMTDSEYLASAQEAGIGSNLAAKIRANLPVTLSDLQATGEGIAHVTEFGYCVHDFSMVPCQKHRDCLNCSEQVCIKGDTEKLERLKLQRENIALQLHKSQTASSEGIYGADRWTQHQLRSLARADELIQVLESPQTPDGAAIWLNNEQEHSQLKRAIAAQTSPTKTIQSKAPELDEIRLLLQEQ
ncbi:integrase [Pseudomonas sp. 5Ae-yellow]|uniref:integrase n=1 Tax=Pseudomonas sp. 5Ae-yellow TaxID=2759848 RepID=UPI0015F365E0|nr:integrase [Pseudomonas sp. 5Ae-yellow]MBA6421833.1 integrase [Pseudomonas sp. 5Ae-yellow]